MVKKMKGILNIGREIEMIIGKKQRKMKGP
jgi:hypothetical protein